MNIFHRARGKVTETPRAACCFLPARKRFIDRLYAFLDRHRGRQIIIPRAFVCVARAYFYFVHPIQYIQLGKREAINAGNANGLPRENRVEPPAAALSARDSAEFLATLTEPCADIVVLLGGKRPASYPRRISLDDAQHKTDGAHADARSGARGARHGIGGCHKRIGAVIRIEHDALRPLEQNALSHAVEIVKLFPYRSRKRQKAVAKGNKITVKRLSIRRFGS